MPQPAAFITSVGTILEAADNKRRPAVAADGDAAGRSAAHCGSNAMQCNFPGKHRNKSCQYRSSPARERESNKEARGGANGAEKCQGELELKAIALVTEMEENSEKLKQVTEELDRMKVELGESGQQQQVAAGQAVQDVHLHRELTHAQGRLPHPNLKPPASGP